MAIEEVYKDLEDGKEVKTTVAYLPSIRIYGNKHYRHMDIDVRQKGEQVILKRIGDFKRK